MFWGPSNLVADVSGKQAATFRRAFLVAWGQKEGIQAPQTEFSGSSGLPSPLHTCARV